LTHPRKERTFAGELVNKHMKHFLKEIIQTPLRTHGPDGKLVVWEKLAENYGVLALEDTDPTVDFLTNLAKKQVGGVSIITVEQYEDYKKKLPFVPKPKPKMEVRLMDMNLPKSKQSPEAEAPPVLTPPLDPRQEHVRAATAKALASSAAEKGSATSAAVAATSEQATVEYFKPKVGRPKLPKPESE
jgi:hypothetical protein